MEEAFIAALLADAGIAALVKTRVNWLTRPAASRLPAIVLQTVSVDRLYTFTHRDSATARRVQIDCWATSFLAAKAVARAVNACLDGLTAAPWSRPEVVAEREFYEPGDAPVAGQPSTDLYRVSLDAVVWHRPTS